MYNSFLVYYSELMLTEPSGKTEQCVEKVSVSEKELVFDKKS